MPLTSQDLSKIEDIFSRQLDSRFEGVFDGINSRFDGIDGRLDKVESRLDGVESRLDGIDSRVDRMESRLLFSMSLLQRDGFDTLDDHEKRIHRLEQIQTS